MPILAAVAAGVLFCDASVLHASALPVTSGLILHLDANDPLDNGGSSLPADNAVVGTWFDTSASGFNGTASGSQRPTFKLNAVNGLPAFRFDGSDDYFTLGTQLGRPASYSIFLVLVNANDAVNSAPFSSNNSGGAQPSGWGVYANLAGQNGRLFYDFGDDSVGSAGTTNNVVMATGAIAILTQTYTPGDNFVRVYADSVLQATTPSSTAATSVGTTAYELTVGRLGAYASSGFYFPGDIAQVIVYDHTLSAGDRNAVGDYLHALYVPEPASLVLLTLGAAACLRRRAGRSKTRGE